MNAREQLTGATYGSNLTASYGFNVYGYPNATITGSIQDCRYSFDTETGNLYSRLNSLKNKSESFTYDTLDRLLTATGPQNLAMTFTANGNLSTKSDIGTTAFGYGISAGPYALTGVSSSTGVIPTTDQSATYTSFEKVSTLTEGVYSAAFVYNAENQRAKMDVTQSGTNILTHWYAGSSYMKETASGVTKEYTYIGGDAYTAPVAAVTQSGTTTYYYLLRDYLGNITHKVNTSNTVVAEYNFDAWGRRRSADDWSYTLDGNDLALFADRGFTGHEYLSWFNLVNMNGRLYDPLVERFLNVDPFIQDPGSTQNYNRYSYCLNNPLKYTDPSGEIWNLLFVWGGNWLMGGMDRWINQKQSFKQAFSPAKNPVVFSTNFSPSNTTRQNNYGFSNPQVDAQNAVKQQAIAGQKASNEIVSTRAQYMGEWHASTNGYSRGVISQSGFYNAFTPMENIGIAGGYFYSFYTDTYQGSEGKWYAKTSASAFAPHAEGMSDKLTYFGRTELIVNGNVISSQKFSIPSEYPSLILQPSYTWLGYTNMQLPTISTNAQLRITISYNSYQWWNGNANPLKPYTYIVNY